MYDVEVLKGKAGTAVCTTYQIVSAEAHDQQKQSSEGLRGARTTNMHESRLSNPSGPFETLIS